VANGAHSPDVSLLISMIVAEMFDGGPDESTPGASNDARGRKDPDASDEKPKS
jgi:hypothetical protein